VAPAVRGGTAHSFSSLDLSPASSYQPFFLLRPAFSTGGSPCPRRACPRPPGPSRQALSDRSCHAHRRLGHRTLRSPLRLRDQRAKGMVGWYGRASGNTAPALPRGVPFPGPQGEADTGPLCLSPPRHTSLGWDASERAASPSGGQGDDGTEYTVPAGATFVPLLEVCDPEPCLLAPHPTPLSASPQQELRTNLSANVHRKANPVVSPRLPELAGWVGQPRYQRVKPLPPPHPESSPPASCRLPASSQALIPAGGVRMASSCCLDSGLCRGGSPHLGTQVCQMERPTHP